MLQFYTYFVGASQQGLFEDLKVRCQCPSTSKNALTIGMGNQGLCRLELCRSGLYQVLGCVVFCLIIWYGIFLSIILGAGVLGRSVPFRTRSGGAGLLQDQAGSRYRYHHCPKLPHCFHTQHNFVCLFSLGIKQAALPFKNKKKNMVF